MYVTKLSNPAPLSEPKNSTCVHKSKNVTVNIDGCVSAGPVESTMCQGTCGSKAMATFDAPYMKTDCKCCKPTKMAKVQVPLTCGKYQHLHSSVVHVYSIVPISV